MSARIQLREVPFDAVAVRDLLAEWDHELLASVPGLLEYRGATVDPADFVPPDGVFLLAVADGAAVGCGGLRRLATPPTAATAATAATGEVKRLFVRSAARGRGVGRILLLGMEGRASKLGLGTLALDTAGREPAALALFGACGYEPIADYNGNPYARHWFEKRI